jgi:hypothetical protein
MENINNPDQEETKSEIPDIKSELEQSQNLKKDPDIAMESISDLEIDNGIRDLFQETVKLYFDIAFKAADKVNLELIGDHIKKKNEEKKNE